MPRRSYTFGSAKSLPSYPMDRNRRRSSERDSSASPERRLSPGPSSSVDVMGTLIEKSYSAGSSLNKWVKAGVSVALSSLICTWLLSCRSAPPSRPSRPPPPRAKSLPKAASLTTYKSQRDREPEQSRPHSKSTAEGQSTRLTRPLSPQRGLFISVCML